jgi:hypothetical protein
LIGAGGGAAREAARRRSSAARERRNLGAARPRAARAEAARPGSGAAREQRDLGRRGQGGGTWGGAAREAVRPSGVARPGRRRGRVGWWPCGPSGGARELGQRRGWEPGN